MEIKEIGKEGLLKRIRTSFDRPDRPGTVPPSGHRGASKFGEQGLFSSVLLMEGVDFDLVYFPLNYLGFKTVTAAAADIYGAGGIPRRLSLSLGLSGRFQVEDVEVFMKGVREACDFYRLELLSFDVTSSLTGFAISASVIGEETMAVPQQAAVNDLICVTGDLGAAFMGLQLMLREKRVFDSAPEGFAQPDFGGREYILERQLKPALPFSILESLKGSDIRPTTLAVLRDGLSDLLVRLSEGSKAGVRIYEKSLPIDVETSLMAEAFSLDPTLAAMHGGEDYQFLFTVPLTDKEKIDEIEGVTAIGFVTDASEGLTLVGRSGGAVPIRPSDYTA